MSSRPQSQWVLLVALTGIALYVCWAILQPFLGILLWATVLVLVFYPVYRRLLPRLGGPSRAAFATTTLVIVTIVVFTMLIMRTPVVIAPVIMRLPPLVVAPAATVPVVPVIIPVANLQFDRRYEGNFRCLNRHGSDQHQ